MPSMMRRLELKEAPLKRTSSSCLRSVSCSSPSSCERSRAIATDSSRLLLRPFESESRATTSSRSLMPVAALMRLKASSRLWSCSSLSSSRLTSTSLISTFAACCPFLSTSSSRLRSPLARRRMSSRFASRSSWRSCSSAAMLITCLRSPIRLSHFSLASSPFLIALAIACCTEPSSRVASFAACSASSSRSASSCTMPCKSRSDAGRLIDFVAKRSTIPRYISPTASASCCFSTVLSYLFANSRKYRACCASSGELSRKLLSTSADVTPWSASPALGAGAAASDDAELAAAPTTLCDSTSKSLYVVSSVASSISFPSAALCTSSCVRRCTSTFDPSARSSSLRWSGMFSR
mmetsp:Transcript_19707/g.64083  ORF Transcript_19707/g.64083 Transcript_19707/m.64083 type:complete len:351 (+) Transcript_19707:315-1367(+)